MTADFPRDSPFPDISDKWRRTAIHTVILHLDNDRAGRISAAALKEIMRNRWEIIDDPPPRGKDFNDFLRLYLGVPTAKTSHESVR